MREAWAWVKKGFSALLHSPFPYQVVDRGGRAIRVKQLCCGRHAFEAQLLQYHKQLEELTPLVSQAESREQEATDILNVSVKYSPPIKTSFIMRQSSSEQL